MKKTTGWKVTTNIINGNRMYGVYRIIDPAEVDHSGNREMYGGYAANKEVAEKIAAMLNDKK